MQWESEVFSYSSARQPPELKHYGIKGQKWGQRRFQEENGTYTAAGRERYGRSSSLFGKVGLLKKGMDKEEARRKQNGKDRKDWKAKDVNDLSDDELRRRNNRLQAEQNYKSNITPQWKKDAKQWGKEAVKAILVTAVATVLAESFKDAIRPSIKNKMNTVYDKASKKSLSSLNSAKHKAAPYLASMLMQKEMLKNRSKRG